MLSRARTTGRALAGQRLRLSVDYENSSILTGALQLVAPVAAEETWRGLELDGGTLDKMSPSRLLELMVDISPEISRALWDFLRLCNPGWDAKAYRLNGKTPAPATQQAVLTTFLDALKTRHGSVDVVIGRLWTGGFLRGAFFAELILDKDGRLPLDIATPDPKSARFIKVDDPQLGQRYQLGQFQSGKWTALDRETIRYVPIDPMPGRPEGRSLAAPALFPCLFSLAMLHDIRRVVQQQGYPRIDLKIISEKLMEMLPDELKNDAEAQQTWIEEVTRQIELSYANLAPDDAYVHSDVVEIGKPVGAVDTSLVAAVDGLMKALERMAIRALKTMGLLFGVSEGTSETLANRQWEVHAAGIKALQHLVEGLLEHLLTLAMQAQGMPCVVKFRFSELRAAELLRDQQVQKLKNENAAYAYDRGWISQDEASQMAVGHEADQETPRKTTTATTAPDPATAEADPGSNR